MRTIERCLDLDVLAQILARRPQGSSLRMVRGTKTREHHLVLVAPATVALCALDAGLVSDGRKTLRLLMINAGMLDALDEGQWYRYVPLMIDSRASMQVTANVPDRSVMRESTVRKAVLRPNSRAALCTMASNTGCTWTGEAAMTFNTSEVAV